MKQNFVILILICFCIGQLHAQERTEKQLKKEYRNSVYQFGYDAFNGFFDPDRELPKDFLKLDYEHRQMLDYVYFSRIDPVVNYQLELMPFEKGDVVADIGIGNGSYEANLYLAGVDDIKIIGLDIDSVVLTFVPRVMKYTRDFLPFHNSAMQLAGNTDETYLIAPEDFIVETKLNTLESTTLADESVDKMICVRTLHHLSPAFVKDMARTLKIGGQVYIVEYHARKSKKKKCTDGGPDAFYMTRAEILKIMGDAGFQLKEEVLEDEGIHAVFEKTQ